MKSTFSASVLATVTKLVAGAFTPLQPVALQFPTSPGVPAFSLRLSIDTSSVCNSSTPGTAGYIDNAGDDMHTFFWLFESKHDAETDPVILWMSGGPGGSSTGVGGLMEIAPCRIAPEGGYTNDNPFGWNEKATLLIVDQPTSVGFSYGGDIPSGLAEASELMDRFLRQLFVAFPQLAERDFYIAGESYGGSWVPSLATTILRNQQHVQATKQGQGLRFQDVKNSPADSFPSRNKIHLKGIMIGNGLIRQSVQNPAAIEELCGQPRGLFTGEQCKKWAPVSAWCEQNLLSCETIGWLSEECKAVQARCTEMSAVVLGELGRNPYDWRMPCGEDKMACYKELDAITNYMNHTDVKKALGVEGGLSFSMVSYPVFEQFEKVGDLWKASSEYVNDLLSQNIRVLIYVGDKDWFCHASGMRRLVDEGLTWNDKPLFRMRRLAPWYSGAKPAGVFKSLEPLTYAEIAEAGHMAPYDQPEATLTLINSFIRGHLPA